VQEGIPALDGGIPDSLRGPDEREACFPCRIAQSPAVQNAARWWSQQAQRAYAAARPHLARAGQKIADVFSRGVDKLGQVGKQTSTSPVKSIDSLRRNILEHRQKIQDYLANPDAFDNQGFLKNAPTPEIRQNIIQGRVRHLETEIRAFEKGIVDLGGKL
jgi:hypothetical protein